MNTFASECSGGFESGWTLYLEHSVLNQNGSHREARFDVENGDYYDERREKRSKDEEAAEEDLSMVSDASSGPPHFPDEEAYFNEDSGCFYPPSKTEKLTKSCKKRQKVKENKNHEDQHQPSFLDDTASSPVFDFSMNNITVTSNQQTSTESVLEFSQGFSATYFERSSFQEHFGFLQPSLSENELQNNQWFGGKGMGMR
ncbi:hypothetical protein L6164_032124 [Bauhinia variegata]|uniref:Uncharacterized protein n=1 Tax=Bauhinia variegata TaxID=167791 RepID=A0ACB9KMW4_BAUVA|nr:hypothetical protein L6164_032124 [Bauhinia variegata]